MDVQELLTHKKKEIRNSQKLADFFSLYYHQLTGGKAKFCCSFSDYDRLKKIVNKKTKKIMKTNSKYEVKYPSKTILKYRDKKGKMQRSHAGNASSDFLDEFINLHNPSRYPKIASKIVQKEAKNKTVPEIVEVINNATKEDLAKFQDDPRKGVQKAIENRLEELNKDE